MTDSEEYKELKEEEELHQNHKLCNFEGRKKIIQ